MNSKLKKIIAIIINLFIFNSAMIISGLRLAGGMGGTLEGSGYTYLKYFTTLSNLYAAGVSLALAIYIAIHFEDEVIIPHKFRIIQFTSVIGVGLTMVTTIVFLAPYYALLGHGYFDLFAGYLFFFHFFNPLLMILGYVLFSKGEILNKKTCLFAVVPMLLYSCFYTPLVITGIWTDFYGFSFGGRYYLIPIDIIVIASLCYLFGLGLNLLDKKIKK